MRYRRYIDLATVSTYRHSKVCLIILESRELKLSINHVTYTVLLCPPLTQLQSRAGVRQILRGTRYSPIA